MSSDRGKKAAKKADELLDARQRRRLKQLNEVERLLVRKLLEDLLTELEEKDGRITSRRGFVSLANAVDKVFDAVEAKRLGRIAKDTAKDMRDLLEFNARYYKTKDLEPTERFKAIRDNVDAIMRKRLGIGPDGDVMRNGFLDQAFQTTPARIEVKKMVAKAVSAGVPMNKLKEQLMVKIAGTPETAGVLERHLGTFVLDTYQSADAITNAEFADRLELRYFIYSGGLIETSREFCRKRNNKIFTVAEAELWAEDPTLPRTKSEKDSGVVTDYVPLQDRGRWNCRHRILYITDEEAYAQRPDLVRPPKPPAPKPPDAKRVPDPNRNWRRVEDVLRLSKGAAPQLDKLSQDIATKNGAMVTPINLKSRGSITRKAVKEEGGDFNEVKDGVRNTIVADLDKHQAIINDLKATPIFWRHKVQDANKDPLGYSGNIINVVMDNGAIGEVQVNTARMIYAKEKEVDARRVIGDEMYAMIAKATGLPGGLGHAIYEEWRLLTKLPPNELTEEKLARIQELERTSREYYSNFR